MLVQQLTTLRTEDFPTQKEWIPKLLFPLNQFLTSVTTILNGNVTFSDNVPGQTQTLAFTYAGTTDFPKTFKWKLGDTIKPVELRVCSATEGGTAIAALIAWSYSQSTVSVSNLYKVTSSGIVGLTVGATYNIVLRGQP